MRIVPSIEYKPICYLIFVSSYFDNLPMRFLVPLILDARGFPIQNDETHYSSPYAKHQLQF
jgi:hypothetical protein